MKYIFSRLCLLCFYFTCLPDSKVSGVPINVFDVIKVHSSLSSEKLWPGFDIKKIPVAIYDSADTFLFFSENPPEGFLPSDTNPGVFIYKGQHPLVRGNSIVKFGETWVATSVLSQFSRRTQEKYSARDLAGIIIHEQFHIFQRTRHNTWRANDGVLLFYPQESSESLFLRRIEKEAFKRAVTSNSESEMVAWALLGLEHRKKRLEILGHQYVIYEKELQRTEGLSDYIEKKARDLDPLNASNITNGIAPAGVRDLGYVEGRWIAFILDKLNDEWKIKLEEKENLFLEEILSDEIVKLSPYPINFTAAEIEQIKNKAEKDLLEWGKKTNDEINGYKNSPGYSFTIISNQDPFAIRIFEPLEIVILPDGSVYHRLIFSAQNGSGSFRFMNHSCITFFDNSYRLTKIELKGINTLPQILEDQKKLILKSENITLELKYLDIKLINNNYNVLL